MIHVFTYYADIYKKEWYANCSCGVKLTAESSERRNDLAKAHLYFVKEQYLELYNGKITPDLIESFVRNGLKPPPFKDLIPGYCEECDNADFKGSLHIGSPLCRSGGIGAGGKRTHCTCEACF